MDVDPVASVDGLTRVTAKSLDAWIKNNLEPSTDFTRQVKETVWQICEFLKRNCFGDKIHVLKTVKGGSAGKGTALKNNSDADVVLFLSCLRGYQEQMENREEILDWIKKRLEACRKSLEFSVNITEPRYKNPDHTPRCLSLSLYSRRPGESIEVDVLPAYDALGQVIQNAPPNAEVYVRLLHAGGQPGEFSPCFTELQKNFVKHHPAKLKHLLRLVKHWYKELLKPEYGKERLPPKYALELLTIYAWEEGTGSSPDFVTAQGFRTVMELLCQHRQICIYWEKYYSLQHGEIGDYVKGLLCRPRPVILDPADPTGILGQGKNWDLMAEAAARYCRSLTFLENVQPWDVEPVRRVKIEVKQLSGTKLNKCVSPYTTIRKLKEMIQQDWDISPCRQRLAQQTSGRNTIILEDCNTLAMYGIFYDTTLVLLQIEMQVLVKDDKNRTTTYTVLPTDTVRQLKEQIQACQGPSANEQRLTYGSRELEDQHTLEHYNIKPMSIIYMLLRLRGGAGPQHP